ncbi:MAG: hypothetical protein KF796_09320 [Ramlibacter sp.]|nr:hypothetical protein [Ramlibacter sp.]
MREELVVIYQNGTVTPLVRSEEHSFSVFGGPLEAEIGGSRFAKPLHHVATINHNQLQILGAPLYVWELPLVYGLFYSGCTLEYTFERSAISIQSVEPKEPTESWPYANFPVLLPYVPLEAGTVQSEEWEQFSRRAPNLPEEQPSEVVVLVPPPSTLGFSMWGRGGDAEGVTIVFECSLKEKRVSAYNVCG